ncbi:MAG: hypothetical protein QG608_1628 [Actinomycetota bacterium]|nr:hypothetical protein [Actinomycetota bacterium]
MTTTIAKLNAHLQMAAAVATAAGFGMTFALGGVGLFLTRSENHDLHGQVNTLQKEVAKVDTERDKLQEFAFDQVRNGNVLATDLCGVVSCGKNVPRSQVVITSPRRGEEDGTVVPVVPGHITVRGTTDLDLGDRKIWILTQVSGVNRLYLQGDAAVGWGSAALDATGRRWTSPTVYIGRDTDAGEHIDVIAVVADKAASGVFSAYLRDGLKTGDFPGIPQLPKGALEYDRVETVRGK